jgi:microsomal dipeptidase-like Zn-dependent dipeptidase
MNRREFLRCCLAAGISSNSSALISCMARGAALTDRNQMKERYGVIADAHAHPYQLHGNTAFDASTPTIEMMKRAGMRASSFSAVGDMVKYPGHSGRPFSDTLNQLNIVKGFEQNQAVRLIRKASQWALLTGSGDAPGAIMAIEGGDALEGRLDHLDHFYDYGVRMITVMHFHDNEIGFNQRSRSDGPLTPLGVRVIERMNALGMLIDVAHAKTRTLKSIAEVSAAPLIDSHTSLLCPGYKGSWTARLRNWSEMEWVARTGGIICTWPLAYAQGDIQRTRLSHWAAEIVAIKKRIGIDHVGLGTDGGGHLPRKVSGWHSILSLPKLIEAMQASGLSEDDIGAYLGGNFRRILNQCIG